MRMREETEFRPKPLVVVGDKPILWHIMKSYAHFGFNEFILTLGYKGHMIKEYFGGESNLTNTTICNDNERQGIERDNFKITFANTGLESLTGERILRSAKYLTDDSFMVTYGDGVANIDIGKLVIFHKKQGTLATITGIHPRSKYGLLGFDRRSNLVTSFDQKPIMQDYISAGFMVFQKEALRYFDKGPMENAFVRLMRRKQISIYRHDGFWKAMDTHLEVKEMNDLWNAKKPWAVWLGVQKNNIREI